MAFNESEDAATAAAAAAAAASTFGINESLFDEYNISLTKEPAIPSNDFAKLISNEVFQYVMTINLSILCGLISLFGIIANIINIIVFAKMKFRETINIALLGLAVADLCSLLTLLWNAICFNPLVMYSDIPLHTLEVHLRTGSWPHFIFVRVASFITVYITFERCMCIVFPLKVKQILTPRRVVIIIVSIYVIIIGCMCPHFATVEFIWKYVPRRNRTMLGFLFKENGLVILPISFAMNATFLLFSFIAVIICSSVLIWKLNGRRKWLEESASTQDPSSLSRDRQVIKMVVCVAVIYIISFTPTVINFLAMALEPELNLGRKYENLSFTNASIVFLCDAINSSANVFIYYRMSSRYNQVFRSLFSCTKKSCHRGSLKCCGV